MAIQGDGDNKLFEKGMNNVDRLLKKLFAVCGTPTDRNKLKNQNAVDLFDENDEDIEFYFDFDDVEGIDLDDEDTKRRKVLRFTDCNNFEVPINTDIIEDFVYLTNTSNNLTDIVNTTLNKAAKDAAEQSDLPLINLQLSIMGTFILKVPKALISSLLTPKIFLPIVMVYKIFKSALAQLDVKVLMRKLSKLFNEIIKQLFWKFIQEFWKLIKIDLIAFLQKLVKKILKNKYKRFITIITALINILNKLKTTDLDNCANLFGIIISTVNNALAGKGGFNVSNLLLLFADKSAGFSQDRALLNVTERLAKAGIPTGPLFGDDNDLVGAFKSLIDGIQEERDANSYGKGTNSLPIITGNVGGPITILPGQITLVTKDF